MKEERTNFIQVVRSEIYIVSRLQGYVISLIQHTLNSRFVRDSPSPVTRLELIERFWSEEAAKLRLKEEKANMKYAEDDRRSRWFVTDC